MNYKEELKFQKHEKDKIRFEINDLQSRIIVASGRNDRFEVDHCRNRINRLKMKLNEISLKIADLEKMGKNGQIEAISSNQYLYPLRNGEINACGPFGFDGDYHDYDGKVIETITRTYERTIIYEDGKPVSSKETVNETLSRRLGNKNNVYLETSIVD